LYLAELSVLRIADLAETEGEFLEVRQTAVPALTNERHGNKILNNEQHLFTLEEKSKIAEKKDKKIWNEGGIVCFVTLKPRRWDENLNENFPFQKDGRLSCLGNSALISREEPAGGSGGPRQRSPRGL